jgi:hypothetical protein
MSATIANIDQILASLATAFGHADVRTACLKFASRKAGSEKAGSDAAKAPSKEDTSDTESTTSSKKSKKEKKESKPRGPSSWNILVAETLKEMRDAFMESYIADHPEAEEEEIVKAAEKAVTYKMAYTHASEKKRDGNPEAQAKYEENKAKRAAKKAEKASSKGEKAAEAAKVPLPPSGTSSDEEEADADE